MLGHLLFNFFFYFYVLCVRFCNNNWPLMMKVTTAACSKDIFYKAGTMQCTASGIWTAFVYTIVLFTTGYFLIMWNFSCAKHWNHKLAYYSYLLISIRHWFSLHILALLISIWFWQTVLLPFSLFNGTILYSSCPTKASTENLCGLLEQDRLGVLPDILPTTSKHWRKTISYKVDL